MSRFKVISAGNLSWLNQPLKFLLPESFIRKNHEAIAPFIDKLKQLDSDLKDKISEGNLRTFVLDEHIKAWHYACDLMQSTQFHTWRDVENAVVRFQEIDNRRDNTQHNGDLYILSNCTREQMQALFELVLALPSMGTKQRFQAAVKIFIDMIRFQPFQNGNHRSADFLFNLILLKSTGRYFPLTTNNFVEYYQLFNTRDLQSQFDESKHTDEEIDFELNRRIVFLNQQSNRNRWLHCPQCLPGPHTGQVSPELVFPNVEARAGLMEFMLGQAKWLTPDGNIVVVADSRRAIHRWVKDNWPSEGERIRSVLLQHQKTSESYRLQQLKERLIEEKPRVIDIKMLLTQYDLKNVREIRKAIDYLEPFIGNFIDVVDPKGKTQQLLFRVEDVHERRLPHQHVVIFVMSPRHELLMGYKKTPKGEDGFKPSSVTGHFLMSEFKIASIMDKYKYQTGLDAQESRVVHLGNIALDRREFSTVYYYQLSEEEMDLIQVRDPIFVETTSWSDKRSDVFQRFFDGMSEEMASSQLASKSVDLIRTLYKDGQAQRLWTRLLDFFGRN